ncbi:GntR family transcriptional regulator [Hoeflea sp. G2-23]|uniref:GntR family transcriptional regulator n=1 Tax=Hoeflea algicola TaxID=2983763 RepID=A0ABT3ZED9_9HYPH|nr:GntR family transcriptional regulator [Hoeflea algicola]MCY0150162.1 GntR family transcriptional regulator [Hoeflea algicola]
MPISTERGSGALSPITRPKSTAEEVEDRLIMAIARGDKVAGERITEAELASALKVSRVPAREAMQKLNLRGILVGGASRGLRIADYGPERLEELMELRLSIEKIVLRQLMKEGADNSALITDLERIVAGMASLSNSGDPVELGSIDLEFHRTIMRYSEKSLAAQIWEGLAQHMLIVFCRDWNDAFDRTGEVALHETLIKFLREGDVKDVESVLTQHYSTPLERPRMKS